MRRIVGILAPLAPLVAIAVPASAHPAIEDPYVPAGGPTTVVLDGPAEEPVAMVGVHLDVEVGGSVPGGPAGRPRPVRQVWDLLAPEAAVH